MEVISQAGVLVKTIKITEGVFTLQTAQRYQNVQCLQCVEHIL